MAVVGVAATVAALGGCGDDDGARAERQREVAARGAEVMPFDLESTTHRFAEQDDGLTQTVVVDRPGDAEQLRLVRRHLREEAERFRDGDFGDPETIHGAEMPGLDELRDHDGAVEVTYREVADGAVIEYTTAEPDLVAALHAWAAAQVSDHGDHADGG